MHKIALSEPTFLEVYNHLKWKPRRHRAIRWSGMHLRFDVVWRSSLNRPSDPFGCTSVLWIIWTKLIASNWANPVEVITSCNGHEYLMADGQLLYITGIIRQQNYGVSVIKFITWKMFRLWMGNITTFFNQRWLSCETGVVGKCRNTVWSQVGKWRISQNVK